MTQSLQEKAEALFLAMSCTLDVSCIVVGVTYGSILLVCVYSLASSSQCLLLVLDSTCFSCATRWPGGPPGTGPENGREGLSMSPPRPTPPFTRRSTFQHELTKDKQWTQLDSLRFHTLLHWLCESWIPENRIQVQLRSRWKEMEIRS